MRHEQGSRRFKLAASLRDILIVRKIRNSCRGWFSRDNGRIGFWQQCGWYFSSYRPDLKAGSYRVYLLYDEGRGLPVGYGAVRLEDGRNYITECVEERYRGLGYGKAIVAELLRELDGEQGAIVAEVVAGNTRSVEMHRRFGFRLESTDSKCGETLQMFLLRGRSQ